MRKWGRFQNGAGVLFLMFASVLTPSISHAASFPTTIFRGTLGSPGTPFEVEVDPDAIRFQQGTTQFTFYTQTNTVTTNSSSTTFNLQGQFYDNSNSVGACGYVGGYYGPPGSGTLTCGIYQEVNAGNININFTVPDTNISDWYYGTAINNLNMSNGYIFTDLYLANAPFYSNSYYGSYSLYVTSVQGLAVALPEPATWLAMVIGFFMIGSIIRRKEYVSRELTRARSLGH